MNNKNKIEKTDISNKNQNSEENSDNIQKLITNEKEFISLINKIIISEFEELFPKILNLPKLDFLNHLKLNVTLIISEQFSSKILENENFLSIINLTCQNFEKKYNIYIGELSGGWDEYNLDKVNQIQNQSNEKLQSYFFTNFRKHCCKTQNFAVHQCNQNGDKGNFIIINGNLNTSRQKKTKYLICNNCRMSFFIHEFQNYCEYCNTNYLCSSLIKDEDDNFLPATLNQPHCENFVNEELLCEKCKNVLYIDIKKCKLKCKNKRCNYCKSIENNKKINFKCKICQTSFYSDVRIYNPIEVIHFKNIINKALLYKRKAYPGKLSCCREIKEKKTDFFHNKDCKGKLYFAEYNQKIIIICSKCKAANHYSKFIWTCPECGLYFRDKKSQESEMKIKKAKSNNKLYKNKCKFPEFEEIKNLSCNNKQSLAELLTRKKSLYEKNNKFISYYNIENYNTERKINLRKNILNKKKLSETGEYNDKTISPQYFDKKKRRMYIFNKIIPWGKKKIISPFKEKSNSPNTNNNNDNQINNLNNERKSEYYVNKVNELNAPHQYMSQISINKNENDSSITLYKSGRFLNKYFGNENNSDNNNENEIDKKIKSKKLYMTRLKGNENTKNKYNLDSKEILNNRSSIEIGYAFNKNKLIEKKEDSQKINDSKCKKFILSKYLQKEEKEIIQENSEYNFNIKSIRNNYKNISLFESQRLKNQSPLNINSKEDISHQIKKVGNRFGNNKESYQSKETTSKGSIESRISLFSHSPIKENNEETKKSNKKIYLKYDNYNNNENIEIKGQKEIEEDDIILPDKINSKIQIEIENDKIKENKKMNDHIQRRLKKILEKGKLPVFNLNNFTIENQIGDGAFGVIYSVYNNKSKKKYAMKKIIANDMNSLEVFQEEFEIAYQNKHPSILDIKGVYLKCFDQTTFGLYVLMDLAEGDWEMEINDRQMIKNFYSEKDLILILKQLSNALFFLQKEKNVAHRDIKPENVLIFKNKTENKDKLGEYLYKICDFGEAKNYDLINDKKQKTLRGTELYMSPLLYEGLIKEETYIDHNAYKSDVFSLGCCMIIAAALDFDIINEIREIKEQMKITRFLKRKLLGKYSEKFIDILLKMINFNEKERIDFIQLEEIIQSKL